MKNLLNHTDLALNIGNNNLETSINIYTNKINVFLSSSNNTNELKKLLYSINIFIYTYFCNNPSINLEDLCYQNLKLMDTHHMKDDLISVGEQIIKSYIEILHKDKPISENKIIEHALSYIHSNIEKKITLEKVANHVHISSNYLCYLFKESTGFKFCEYINICRTNAAKDFLDNTSYPLEMISFKSGFNSQSHFCTTFKKYLGVSPNGFRKREH
ncbi:helix-turn-helix transcriptional regulator [Clostridium estertheticum]|uniref:Helix-turn-helix transcriptional regulator n=1 Tax=Clostridium estertheticum TaxID=238834 RepID=A0A7Y3SSG7_9CLOT|nr:AraC family transcriptional regulator [Clostridium estertheticum]MBW9171526.1 AraC family transcriptional regulator [Clostridium estertheticum]NNU74525.1 helix-turn-helix transcriptional regulator [Clostridium estertheticum]WBL48976.1 AraC family transcriptional regulator [Clostridium estertheticum]WLC77027.1 AraC family transcriptional regulator [Clostridium estertheticum]